MKILVVQDTDWLRRGPHQQHHVFEELSVRGHQVKVVDFPLTWRGNDRSAFIAPPVREENVARLLPEARIGLSRPRINRMPIIDKAMLLPWYVPHLKKLSREWSPDVVVGHGILTDLAARIAIRGRIPYVAHVLDALHTMVDVPGAQPLARRLEAMNYRRASSVIVINSALKTYVEALSGRRSGIDVIPTGVRLSDFARDVEREAVRRSLNIENQLTLFFMGWLYPFSGVERLADEIIAHHHDVRLVVVGSGDLLPELTKRTQLPGGDRIIVLGQQPYARIPALLSAADVCVLPSAVNETMAHIVPIKMYEYLAAGKPVVAAPLGGIREEFAGATMISYATSPREVIRAAREFTGIAPEQRAQRARALVASNGRSEVAKAFEGKLLEVVGR